MSEYVPYFRKRPELFERFKLTDQSARIKNQSEGRKKQDEEMRRTIESDEVIPLRRSGEYCSGIIYAIETGIPTQINGNVKNNGLITNLPQGCCVEVPCLIDKNGIHPCYVGNLPPQCAALNRTNVNVQELGVLAAVEKDRNLAFQAVLVDPLTSAVLTIDETRSMIDEMFNAEAKYLKDFK
jgi:alpha-galactosidase